MEETQRQAFANQHQRSLRLRYAGRPDSSGASGKRAKIAVSIVEKIGQYTFRCMRLSLFLPPSAIVLPPHLR